MSGNHWASTYIKDNVINYFNSFGMALFQEKLNLVTSKSANSIPL